MRIALLFLLIIHPVFVQGQRDGDPAVLKKYHVRKVKEVQYLTGKKAGPWVKHIVEYDTNGIKTRQHEVDIDSSVIAMTEFAYDSAGRLLRDFFYSYNDTTRSCIRLYSYSNGRLVFRRDSSFYTGQIIGSAQYSYAAGGREQTCVNFDQKGNPRFKLVTTYDSTGRTIETISYDFREGIKPDVKRVYTYDASGRLQTEQLYLHDMKNPVGNVTYEYDERGLMSTYRYAPPNGKGGSLTKIEYLYFEE